MKKLTSIRKIKSSVLVFAIILGVTAFFPHESNAGDVSLKASLSDDTVEAGQTADLTIQITGALNVKVPGTIDVNGLSIEHRSGPNINVQWVNGNTTQSVSHTYLVQTDRAGTFTIPAITVSVNGANLSTNPVTLTVTARNGGGGNHTATAPDAAESDSKIAFAELVVPKQNAYVGEAIPVELRVYFDQRARFSQLNMPDIKCEGFTMQKLTKPRQDQVEKNGRNYDILSFKTAVTPVKTGKLTLGPAEMQCVVQIPQQRKPQRRNTGGIDDFFNDDLFNQMMGISPPRQYTVTSSEIVFEVKPLPLTGQPKNFSGAVGQFSLATEAAPLKLKVGDPITLKLKISGRGNFDRVMAPVMVDEAGWRNYPPSAKFTADDDIGIIGSKAFEMAVIPNEKKTKLPEVEFSYFDPVAEKYVTLGGQRLPITVEGETPPPPAVIQGTPSAQTASTPEPAKKASDIQYIMTGPAQWNASFTPLFRRRVFWNAQAVPALALLVFVGIQVSRRKERDLLAKQFAAWRREQHDLMRILQRSDTEQADFYDAAIRYIQIAAARTLLQTPESIGPAEAIASRPFDDATGEGVQSIFNAHGELRYAGVAAGGGKIPDLRRQEVLETLRKFQDASE